MKTSSNTLEGPEANPQQIRDMTLPTKTPRKKLVATSKEHHNSEISLNQILNLKKKLTLLITLAIALAAFLMTACEDDPELCNNCSTGYPAPAPAPTPPTDQIAIRSIHPSAGAPGFHSDHRFRKF